RHAGPRPAPRRGGARTPPTVSPLTKATPPTLAADAANGNPGDSAAGSSPSCDDGLAVGLATAPGGSGSTRRPTGVATPILANPHPSSAFASAQILPSERIRVTSSVRPFWVAATANVWCASVV